MQLPNEDDLLRSVAIQNAKSILQARQRAEEELYQAKEALEARSEELARSLSITRATLEAATDGILVTSESGHVIDFNQRFTEIWGFAPDKVRTSTHRQILTEQIAHRVPDPAAFLARIDQIYAESPNDTYDLIALKDGRTFERYTRVLTLHGRRIGRVWSLRDISDRRRAEAALHDETRILELLNKTGTTLTEKLDLQGLVQAVTDSATQLSGAKFGAFFYTVTDAHGDSFQLYTLSGAPREAFEKLGHPRATAIFGPTFRGEAPIRIDDVLADPRYGQSAPHHGMPPRHLPVRSYMGVPVISRSGNVIGGLFFGHPEPGVFTEKAERLIVGVAAQAAVAIDNARLYEAAQKASEEREELLASERFARAEAERASQMKDEFLATLSHELRTPLSSILGWSQVLRNGARSEADLQKGLDIIERNARVQTQLIEDLLDMSRIISGKVRLDIQPVEMLSVIESAIETVRPAAEARNVRLEKLLDSSAIPISGDPSRLQQVVWNLLSNAIKFTPRGGKVQVVLERVDSHVEIHVTDTGIGIEPRFLNHVFERFRQADASTTRQYGGLGLGLSIVKHLVELHGGTVQARSQGKDQGATFTVALPLMAIHRPSEGRSHPRAPKAAPIDFKNTDLNGVKVLVVDDQVDARELVALVLADCNAEVFIAGDAEEALEIVQRERPTVLVSDIGMPDVDGYELLRRIRALGADKGGKVPAIALTAFARSEDRTRALRSGFLVHVSKPVEPSELIACVASVAGRVG